MADLLQEAREGATNLFESQQGLPQWHHFGVHFRLGKEVQGGGRSLTSRRRDAPKLRQEQVWRVPGTERRPCSCHSGGRVWSRKVGGAF